ncbi:MAG: hypothetical protein HC896_17365 [Bacteroidales bacterium]|nr:hypothetical protein [Bacteroidales bacterium]
MFRKLLLQYGILKVDQPKLMQLSVFAFIWGAASYLFIVPVQATFLGYYETSTLPMIFCLSGIFGTLVSIACRMLGKWLSLNVLFWFFAALMLLSYLGLQVSGYRWIEYFPMVMSFPLMVFMFNNLQKFLKDHNNNQQHKNISWITESSFIVGAAFGSYWVTLYYLFKPFNPELLLIVGFLFAGLGLAYKFFIAKKYPVAALPNTILPSNKTSNGLSSIWQNALYKKSILYFLFSALVFFFAYYALLRSVNDTFRNVIGYAKFLGIFTGAMLIFGFFTKHFLMRRLLLSYDSPYTMFLLPIVYGSLTILLISLVNLLGVREGVSRYTIQFMFVTIMLILMFSLRESVEYPGINIMSNILGHQQSSFIRWTLYEPVTFASLFLSGAAAYLFAKDSMLNFSYFSYAMIIMVSGMTFFGFKALKACRLTIDGFIREHYNQRFVPVAKYLPVNERIYKLNLHKSTKEMVYTLKLAENLYPLDYKNALLSLINNQDDTLRAYSIKKIGQHKIIEAKDRLVRQLQNETVKHVKSKIEQALSGFKVELEPNLSIEKTVKLAESKGPQDRILASHLIGILKHPDLVLALVHLIKDYDYRVRHAAIENAINFKDKIFVPYLIEYLEDTDYCIKAYDALKRLGEEAIEHLENNFITKTCPNFLLYE